NGRGSRVLARLGAPCPPVTLYNANLRVEDWFQGEPCSVGLEILDNVSARWIPAVSLRYRQPGQAGAGAIRVEMETVVMPPPDRADHVGLFKDRGVQSPRPKRRRRGEAGGTGADDDCVA